MKEGLTKKIIIIVSVVSAIVITFVVLAFATGNTHYPNLSDPNGVFYQRLDDQGNVIYTITNQDIYEEIKSNNGIQQLIYMTDSMILSDYLDQVTQEQIDNKILELTYGTSDPTIIADMSDADKAKAEKQFAQQILLSSFQDNEDEYARILVARELYAREKAAENDQVTEQDVANAYLNSYFSDISEIRLRFTSTEDAAATLRHFNLLTLSDADLREYNGYVYNNETLVDSDNNIIQAYIPVSSYYFDENSDIAKANGDVMYELGANDAYYLDGNSYNIDPATGDLVDASDTVVIPADQLFDTQEEAQTYKDDNTVYYTVTKTDPYNMDETTLVKDSDENVIYTIDPDGTIYDAGSNDVTDTTDLVVNKVYTAIEDVNNPTANNTTALTDEEMLAKYVDMYNYIYGTYRDLLPTGQTAEQLTALDSADITYNFDAVTDISASLATYMFKTLSIADDNRYTEVPVNYGSFYYMAYKLSEGTKTDVMDTIFGYVAPLITIPTVIGDSIQLPTTTYYNGTITWGSSDSDVITNVGVVTVPSEDTAVDLTYTITILGDTYEGTIAVTVLADGSTQEVTEPTWTEISLKTIINDDATYNEIYNKLLDDYVYGDSGSDNVTSAMEALRADLGFKIFDHYVGLDYQQMDSTFVIDDKGDKTILASFDKTLTSDQPITITADEFFTFAVAKNSALYTLYASQYKEQLYSQYYTSMFGTQRNITKNKSSVMDQMYSSVDNAKQYYAYLQKLYSNYGLTFNFNSFMDYAYVKYNTKTELELLQYFVEGKLQPYFIHETLQANDVVDMIYDTVQDNYQNYFDLNVTQLLVYVDFDEDGDPDNFNDYEDSLTDVQLAAFQAQLATLEHTVSDYDGTFSDLITEYNDAARDDATWGQFKQAGFLLLTEDLNMQDKNDSSQTHALNYNGDYGVKDTYVPEFVTGLVDLYQEYLLPQNVNADELESDAVATQFGLHFILATKGADFDQPTCEFTEEDSSNPVYSDGAENANGAPSLEQMQLYALYKFYSDVYDLSDTTIEETYGITVPDLPTSVISALDFYMGGILDNFYVFGTLNVNITNRLQSGEFLPSTYTSMTNNELMTLLQQVGDVYYDAVFSDYTN